MYNDRLGGGRSKPYDEYTFDHDTGEHLLERGAMYVITRSDGSEIEIPIVNIRRIESTPEWAEVD